MRRTEEREGEEGVRKRGRLARSPPSLWTLLSLFARLTLQERSDTPCIMGGVNKKGVPKRERKNKITNVESCLNQVFFKLVNSVFLFCQPPQASAHAFVISTFLVSHSLEGKKRTNKTIDTVPLRQISLAQGSVSFSLSLCCRQSRSNWTEQDDVLR